MANQLNSNIETSLKIQVPPEWDMVFSHFYFAFNNSSEAVTHKLVPDYRSFIVFNFGEPLLAVYNNDQYIIKDSAVSLPIKKILKYTLPPQGEILVGHFVDDGFYRFFKKVLTDDLPQFIHPDDLLNSECFAGLSATMSSFTHPVQRVNYLLNFAKAYLLERERASTALLPAIKETVFNPVKVLAEKEKVSERNIQLQYKKFLGYNAKEKSRYDRFLLALEQINMFAAENSKPDWLTIMESCGYYDQSHLINDFKHYTGLSPTNYLKLRNEFCIP